jgi:hypothetical protein|tara:strand:+ start:684 stop:863 length:180 start_codon:yes stop_codon:yes gene_type:complete
MPKKKLTKAQVKRKLKTIDNATASLILDKVEQTNSFVSMSLPRLLELSKPFRTLLNRLK